MNQLGKSWINAGNALTGFQKKPVVVLHKKLSMAETLL
jgi:hypothetical protein